MAEATEPFILRLETSFDTNIDLVSDLSQQSPPSPPSPPAPPTSPTPPATQATPPAPPESQQSPSSSSSVSSSSYCNNQSDQYLHPPPPSIERTSQPQHFTNGGFRRDKVHCVEVSPTPINGLTHNGQTFTPVHENGGTDLPCNGAALAADTDVIPSLNVLGLSYTVKARRGHWWNGSFFKSPHRKRVLQNLCMTFQNRELSALVGGSGSGKTSLLDAISCRAQGEIKGVVTYKNDVCTRELMKQCSSYVLQADRLLPTLTVRETLTYMAYLKLPGHLKDAQINAKVDCLLNDMGLRHVANSRVGGSVVRGVSGGEKRRITIAIQLLKDPEIILLDEPTSGLDAFTARHLVSSLSKLAHQGKMVIMSIHQPRSDIFNLLDKVAILTVGRLAFLGRPNQLVPYFTSIGYPCPLNQNPCDVYIDITSVDRRSPTIEKETTIRANEICDSFTRSNIQGTVIKDIAQGFNSDHQDQGDGVGIISNASWSRTCTCILSRMHVHVRRDTGNFLFRCLVLPFYVIFIWMFVGKFKNNQESIQDRMGIIYECLQVPTYVGFTNALGTFPTLREVYYRESSEGLYSTFTFLLAYFVHVLPYNIFASAGFASFMYWAVGFYAGMDQFLQFLVVCVVMVQCGEMLTVGFLGILRDVMLANFTAAMVLWASGLVSTGLLRSVEKFPLVVQWLSYVSFHRYSSEIMMFNEFHNLTLTCGTNRTGLECTEYGDAVLDRYYEGVGERMSFNWFMMWLYFVVVAVTAAGILKVRGIPVLH